MKKVIIIALLITSFTSWSQIPISYEYFDKALKKAEAGNLKGALADYTTALKYDPLFSEAYLNRAMVKIKMGDTKGALADVNTTIDIDPKRGDAYTTRANINYKTENVAERVKALTGGRGVDAIIDMDFSTTADLLRKGALAPHGTVSCYGSNSVEDTPIPFRVCLPNSLSLQFFLIYDLTPDERSFALKELNALLKAGVLTHAIGARYPLSDIIQAHEAVEQGKVMGNIVIDIA